MPRILRPNEDIEQSGSWVRVPLNTLLWDVINESIIKDSDYVWHNNVSGEEYFEVGLLDPKGVPGSGVQTIRWRARKLSAARTVIIRCELREGMEVKAQQSQTLGDAWQIYSFNNIAEIADWANLCLRFIVESISGGGALPDPAISWAEFDVPSGGATAYEWIGGRPVQSNESDFEWVAGIPYILIEKEEEEERRGCRVISII